MRKFLASLLFAVALPAAAADKPWPFDMVIGKPDAPITIIEYGSLTCSHCAAFEAQVIPQLKKEWLDTGKARLIYRDFVRDPMDQAAAMISHCAGDDRYFAFIETFYHSQANWLQASRPLEALKGIARLGGMSGDQVDACLRNETLLNRINARKDDGAERYGIAATPTFVINGKVAANAPADYDGFAKLLK